MKKFFRTKEAGTITPLPPTSPATSNSSFGTPRPFDEYQARVAHQQESHRPLSYQAPSTRSGRGSSDENGLAQPYSSSHRRSQQIGPSDPSQHTYPNKSRFSHQIHNPHSNLETAYESYSDPVSAHSQPYRPPYDRSNTADFDTRAARQPTSGLAAHPPPMSLRPAQPSSRHRPNNSLSVGVASGNTFQHQNGTNLASLHLPPPKHASSMDSAWAQRRATQDSDEEDDDEDDDDETDERTPTTTGAHRSAAYPVYSVGDDDQDTGEVLISQGRYEETVLREPPSKDKAKGKKLFGFTTGGKDKKAKQERDRNMAPSPTPRSSRDRDDSRLMSPPMDANNLPAHDRASKEGGWMDRWNKRAHQQQAARLHDKEAEEIAASKIGWLAAHAYSEQDWMQILPLIDIVSHSEAASKEAARALRKEFKYGTVDTQRRAVRIWALLTLNASDRFRLQIATKRFLDAIEDTVASSKTPLSVKETMLRVLGVLAFEFRGDAELAPVTKCWNKIKPNDRPKDGEPLENDLFEFRLPQPRAAQLPPARRTSQRHSQPSRPNETSRGAYTTDMVAAGPRSDDISSQRRPPATYAPPPQQPPQIAAAAPTQSPPTLQQTWSRPNMPPPADAQSWITPPFVEHPQTTSNSSTTDVVSNLEAAAASMESRSASYQSSAAHEPITLEEDVRRLHEECQIARSNASVLLDTLLHEGLHNDTAPLVDEFYDKVARSQDLIASQIPWASAQADRTERGSQEEALLADLLDAHGRTSEAVRVVDDARRRIQEEEEERQVTERSKVEVRLDRSALAQDSNGDMYDLGARGQGLLGLEREYGNGQASGSRSPSPAFAQFSSSATAPAVAPPSAGVLSPDSGHSSSTTGNGPGVTPRVSRPLPIPRSDQSSDSNSTRSAFNSIPHQSNGGSSHPYPVANSLTASIHSTTSTAESHAAHTHSQESSSQRLPPPAASTGRSLPLTPNLNIDTNSHTTRDESGLARNDGNKEMGYGEDEDDLQTPIVPSEKALGKRRAVSVRYPSPPLRGKGGEGQAPPELPPHPPRELISRMGGLRLGH